VIELNPEMATVRKPMIDIIMQRQRLSPEALQNRDAIVRTHGNNNRERSAEMTGLISQTGW